MSKNLYKIIKESITKKPKLKKTIGVILILIGLVALLTPLTPGSWLVFVGLELLGARILLFDKSSAFRRSIKKVLNKLKFCPPTKADPRPTDGQTPLEEEGK